MCLQIRILQVRSDLKKYFSALWGGSSAYPEIWTVPYYTMILQRTRIFVGYTVCRIRIRDLCVVRYQLTTVLHLLYEYFMDNIFSHSTFRSSGLRQGILVLVPYIKIAFLKDKLEQNKIVYLSTILGTYIGHFIYNDITIQQIKYRDQNLQSSVGRACSYAIGKVLFKAVAGRLRLYINLLIYWIC